MSTFTVGSVPYANAIPLVAKFEMLGPTSPVRVVYDVPSKLPQMLEDGTAQAILVSSVDALRIPGRRMAAGVCIGSNGPVKSVRMFSKVPFAQIKTIALDRSSMTSNRLARLLLDIRFDARPECVEMRPNQSEMLASHDACVLIGDIGMTAPSLGLEALDLGAAWTEMTNLPFVWAAWIGGELLTEKLAGELRGASAEWAPTSPEPRSREELISFAIDRLPWPEEMIRDYFFEVMVYDMDERMIAGLREFQKRLLAAGFEDCSQFPAIVG
jgi:chorismate dehydratase